MTAPWADQRAASVRFEWGPSGIGALQADTVVVVDVLRFTTAVEAATANGVAVYPYRWRDESAHDFARTHGALLAHGDGDGPSLSPVSLLALTAGTKIVLPSPNGSTCTALAQEGGATVVAACLRNRSAVAGWLATRAGAIAVIACGERWPDGSLRPALEDLLGAGAVIAALRAEPSPEARAAAAAWRDHEAHVVDVLAACSSGREQVARGWQRDLDYAAQVDASTTVPVLVDGAYVDVSDR
jgi:2-phosphosulfolactate phosphatase